MRINKRKILISLGVVMLLAVVAGGYYLWQIKFHPSPARIIKQNQLEADGIIAKVAKLAALPDETPIVSKINDITQPAMRQPFFAGAVNGDYLLIYKNAAKAVLFSEKQNKILNMGPLNTGSNQAKENGGE